MPAGAEDGAGAEKGDPGGHRLDGADRIGARAFATRLDRVENLESENGEEGCGDGHQNMGAQPRLSGVNLAFESDHRPQEGRDQQANGDDMLGEIGLNEAEFVADIHGSDPGCDAVLTTRRRRLGS
jgi:hypothetical protein